jgi:hypothetical protein
LPIARGQPLDSSDPASSSGPTRCRSRANAGCRGADHRCRPQSETVNRWVRTVNSCAQTPQLPALRHGLHSDPAASRLPVHRPATLGARPEDCWGTSLPSSGRCHPLTPGLRAMAGSADDTVRCGVVASGRVPTDGRGMRIGRDFFKGATRADKRHRQRSAIHGCCSFPAVGSSGRRHVVDGR